MMNDDLKKMADEAGLDEDEQARLAQMQDEKPVEIDEGDQEAPPDEEAAPEPKPDEKPEEKAEEPEPQPEKPKKKPSIRDEMVEYRKKSRELEEKLAAAEKQSQERLTQVESRYAAMIDQLKAERSAPPKPETPPEPSLEESPVEYFDSKIKQLSETVQQLAQSGQMDQAAAKHNEAVIHDITAYRQQNPEYDQAFSHLVQRLDRVYAASGVEDPNVRYQLCQEQIRNVTAHSLQQGKSACARLFEMSKEFGYAPPDPTPPPTNGNGKMSADDIQRIARGQNEAAGMPGAGDARGAGLTYSAIADMDQKELDKLVAQHGSMEKLLQAATPN
jgi:hypothetical protein